MKPVQTVLITQRIPQVGIDKIKDAGFSLVLGMQDGPMPREELLRQAAGKEGILTLLHDRVDEELIHAADKARIFSNYAVGYNNIDIEACRMRGIRVGNTPGVLTDATADLAWALLLGAARRVAEADAFTRAGKFVGWAPGLMLGADVTGKTLGIIGLGRIGAAVAQRAGGFRMRVLFTDSSEEAASRQWNECSHAEKVSLPCLLSNSDFISIHCPYTPDTHHLIGSAEFSLMKPSAILVNSARGPIVDEAALVEALRHGAIAGAGLDVYEDEPKLAAGLAELPNTLLLPHLGSATIETRNAMAIIAADNLIAVLNGMEPPHAVV